VVNEFTIFEAFYFVCKAIYDFSAKFDESLKMVVDVSQAEKVKILNLLQRHFDSGEIFFGYHASPNALLTCFVRGPHEHVHFVDAADGGYAMAAKMLKAQRASHRPA
jgi:hypothetical protein